MCGGGCDVCAAAAQLVQEHDVSAAAACALRAVARLPGRLSMRQLEKVLRGSRDRKLIADGKVDGWARHSKTFEDVYGWEAGALAAAAK